jgi:hypothetical protein
MAEKIKSTEATVILQALDSIKSANEVRHEELKERLKEGLRGIRIQLAADNEVINDHLERINNSVAKHEERLDLEEDCVREIKKVVDDYTKFRGHLTKIGKKWYWIIIGLFLFILVTVFIYDAGMVGRILEFIISKF